MAPSMYEACQRLIADWESGLGAVEAVEAIREVVSQVKEMGEKQLQFDRAVSSGVEGSA